MSNRVCPNCGGLWDRLYESQHGSVCKYCLREYEDRQIDHSIPV